MSSRLRVTIAEVVSPDLMLRGVADSFFDMIETTKAYHVMVDFAGISSISRSFARQYILRKRRTTKKVEEVNIPDNVSKMFDLVQRALSEDRPRNILVNPEQLNVVTI